MNSHIFSSRLPAILVTEDGRCFRGVSFGAPGETFGEAVFTTAMTGFQEALTDPGYHRQVLVATGPHIGDAGWDDEDPQSQQIWVGGFVLRDQAQVYSKRRSNRLLAEVLREQGVVGIAQVDTRALTGHLREKGTMRVGISTIELDPDQLLGRVLAVPRMSGVNLSNDVTTNQPVVLPAQPSKRYTVAAVDFGLKDSTLTRLTDQGVEVHLLPASATFDDLWQLAPDGVFFSNGPGDPITATAQVDLLWEVLEAKLPFFGVGFGHQIFGWALGFDTYKLRYGHHGANQPVKDLATGKVEITAQSHSFAVDAPIGEPTQTRWGQASVSHICLNDNVVEGLELRAPDGRLLAFSVQYHPLGAAGPHDSVHLIDRFHSLLAAGKEANN